MTNKQQSKKNKKRGGPRRGRRSGGASRQPSSRSSKMRTYVANKKNSSKKSQKPEGDFVKFVPLGGLEEIGRNCYFFEHKDEIVLIDIGIQFPEEETPGIDFIIPNIEYLEKKKDNIKAIFLTHGHYDHIAAIHYLIERLGNPLIYTAEFTKELVKKRHQEFPNAPKLNFQTVKHGSKEKISKYFNAEFFHVDHTIPDALGFVLETPVGNMVSFGDFRLTVDREGNPQDLEIFEEIGKKGIHTIFTDSTNAWREGFSSSELTVEDNLDELIGKAEGRVIVATFSSLLTRLFEIVSIAEKHGRKVAVNGRSMKDNLSIAQQLGYFKPAKGQMIPIQEINKHKDHEVLVLTTGAQGEPNAGLMRIVNGEHRFVTLKRTDTVIFSSSVVPGNERSVQSLQDNIARQIDELYNTKLLDVHTSGHAHREDLKLVIELTKPKYIVPIHGYYFFRSSFKKIVEEVGRSKKDVIMMDNGQVALIEKDKVSITQEQVPASYVMVDGLGVGDVEEVVLRDRLNLAEEGMMVIIVVLNKNGKIVKNPDIISRGFIYIKDNFDLLDDIRKKLKKIISQLPGNREIEPDYVRGLIRDQIGQYLYSKTKRRPMVLPVVIKI